MRTRQSENQVTQAPGDGGRTQIAGHSRSQYRLIRDRALEWQLGDDARTRRERIAACADDGCDNRCRMSLRLWMRAWRRSVDIGCCNDYAAPPAGESFGVFISDNDRARRTVDLEGLDAMMRIRTQN